mmetsp:Transcript_36555/g.53643  ORF Transcript_36555/g.53643 Transcript_36555/m.53643 type:complete len:531 (+) Transcript_36555:215-1807(+)|eukprot:CAMPEP_0195522226 /NCGR_PEP_ID=MMETSP0794_2-20130614/20147_1 /TAXON_ID=515487 /ORGANISM="Stephanopyxis turris, Strain CCMP 815" /LENGTH=530 /DNA_ID=CAMNT_0040651927 /DNA_START=209 /DNA_END=1801 /DNA_ORIENTATION=+
MSTSLVLARHLIRRSSSTLRPTITAAVPNNSDVTTRSFGVRRRVEMPTPPEPGHTIDSIQPPEHWEDPTPQPPDPMAYNRKPVTSAAAIDLSDSASGAILSKSDVASLTADGKVVHGKYGELNRELIEGIPLEYLAMLGPAAEGAAALREIGAEGGGTVLVYGASQPAAMSALQLATAEGMAVAAVVDGQHSGNDEMVDVIKGLAVHPGFAVAEEYAMVKQNFKELVQATVGGDEAKGFNCEDDFLGEFKDNLMDYAALFPEGQPAVSAEEMAFRGKEKDRKHFKDNMEAYLGQFARGVPKIAEEDLKSKFNPEQYAVWKNKFNEQTSSIVTGEDPYDGGFEPGMLVKRLIYNPEEPDRQLTHQEDVEGAGDFVPYQFSVLEQKFGTGVEPVKGGPVVGAVITATPVLQKVFAELEGVKGLRAKAEALQFMTETERKCFAGVSSVLKLANDAKAQVVVVGGSLPGLKSVSPTPEDAKNALAAMEIEEDGSSKLNFFIQVYRAGDYPVYESYAIHRATEILAGPRQIVVTK